jgi:hypothetical protein
MQFEECDRVAVALERTDESQKTRITLDLETKYFLQVSPVTDVVELCVLAVPLATHHGY